MEPPTKKDLSIFEFGAEEEAVEALSHRFKQLIETKKPSRTDVEVLDKRDFLLAFQDLAFERTDAVTVVCVDSPERDGDLHQVRSSPVSDDELGEKRLNFDEIMTPSMGYDEIEILDEEDDTVSVSISDEDEIRCPNECSEEIPDFCSAGSPQGGDGSCIMQVVVSPDYIVFRRTCYGDARLMFRSDGIRIDFSSEFVLEWAIDDIVRITVDWSLYAEVSLVHLYLRSSAVAESDRTNDNSVVEVLKFSVDYAQLGGKVQSIMSLASRYREILDNDFVTEDDAVGRSMFISKDYFADFEMPREDLIYPKEALDAVTVRRKDIEVLQPDTFINDTIIDFYIQHLKSKLPPDEKRRFHFFNCFFFRKLADLDKDPQNALEGKEAFQRVRKWTRKVNMFEKDYIFIPVNFSFHWSLLVICHPGEIDNMRDGDVKEFIRVPCILHMNSIKGSHKGLDALIQSYLWEEWKERHQEPTEDCFSRFSNLRFVSLDLPQQKNSSDCGLFLLHYVELFLKEAPANFNPFSVTKFSSFLTENWFLPAEASHKRAVIRQLIYDLVCDCQRPTVFPRSNMNLNSGWFEKDHELVSPENSAAAKVIDSVPSVIEEKFELKLLATSSTPDVSECSMQGMVVQNFLAPRATTEVPAEGRRLPFKSSVGSCDLNCVPEEENADTNKQSVSTSLCEDGHHPMKLNTALQNCSTSYAAKDVEAFFSSWLSEGVEVVDTDSSSESLSIHCAVSCQEANNHMPCFLLKNYGYVPDTPSASDDDWKDSYVDSHEIDSIVADGLDCEVFQELFVSKLNFGGGGDCEYNGAAKAEMEHIEDCQKIESSKEEEPDIKDSQNVDTDLTERADSENCQNVSTAKSEGVNDQEEVGTTKADMPNDDTQATEATSRDGDDEIEKCDTADASIVCSNGHCSESFPSQSFQNIVVSDDEGSFDGIILRRRYEPGARSKQQPCKRRKLMPPV